MQLTMMIIVVIPLADDVSAGLVHGRRDVGDGRVLLAWVGLVGLPAGVDGRSRACGLL